MEQRHDLATQDIAVASGLRPGDKASVTVPIKDVGDMNETGVLVELTISGPGGYNQKLTGSLNSIARNAQQDAVFTWDTTGLVAGSYMLTATAVINNDSNPSDNTKTETVTLQPPLPVQVSASPSKQTYDQGEALAVNVMVRDPQEQPTNGTVRWQIKRDGNVEACGSDTAGSDVPRSESDIWFSGCRHLHC